MRVVASLTFALTLTLTSGCMFHVQSARNAPGLSTIQEPPPSLTRSAVPEDPGERGVAISAAVNGGLVGHSHDIGGMLGAELGVYPYATATSGESFIKASSPVLFGGAAGWTFFRGSEHGRDTFGPIYGEARAIVAFGKSGVGSSRFGLGAAFNPQSSNAGPQASACIGLHPAFFYVCMRGSYMIGGEGAELYAYLEVASFLEYGWSK
ncbi:hypothetical protein BH09MYX1_BH09MYX1_50250 [soil metagenome]